MGLGAGPGVALTNAAAITCRGAGLPAAPPFPAGHVAGARRCLGSGGGGGGSGTRRLPGRRARAGQRAAAVSGETGPAGGGGFVLPGFGVKTAESGVGRQLGLRPGRGAGRHRRGAEGRGLRARREAAHLSRAVQKSPRVHPAGRLRGAAGASPSPGLPLGGIPKSIRVGALRLQLRLGAAVAWHEFGQSRESLLGTSCICVSASAASCRAVLRSAVQPPQHGYFCSEAVTCKAGARISPLPASAADRCLKRASEVRILPAEGTVRVKTPLWFCVSAPGAPCSPSMPTGSQVSAAPSPPLGLWVSFCSCLLSWERLWSCSGVKKKFILVVFSVYFSRGRSSCDWVFLFSPCNL